MQTKDNRSLFNGEPAKNNKKHDPGLEATGSKGKHSPDPSSFNDEEYNRWTETLKKKNSDGAPGKSASPSPVRPFFQLSAKGPDSCNRPN